MRAILLRGGRPLLVERPTPRPAPGEALVRVAIAGICGTDLEIARGYFGFDGVPGHEFVGTVASAPGARRWVGRRVVGEINVACDSCEVCRSGLHGHCPRRTVLGIAGRDGAFAEALVLPLRNLHEVPERVPDEAAVFVEPLAAAHRILDQVAPAPGSRALVLGDGRLGQLAAAVLARAGIPPVVCGRHPEKLRRLERLGLRATVSPGDLAREYDLVVEATGSPEGLRTALSLVVPLGTVVLKSTYHGGAAIDLTPIVVDEVRIVGSRCGELGPALDHLASEPSLTEGLVTARFALEDAAAAFARAAAPDAIKVLLDVGGGAAQLGRVAARGEARGRNRRSRS